MATYPFWWDDETARAYLVTEEARLLCEADADAAQAAFSEAAYYLSDPLDPDTRGEVLRTVERHVSHVNLAPEKRLEDALVLATEAAAAIERVEFADSELCLARRALRRGIRELATNIGLARATLLLLHDTQA